MYQILAQEGTQVNVQQLDSAVSTFYTTQNSQERQNLDKVMILFSQRKDFPFFFRQIIQSNCSQHSKLMTYSGLKNYINSSWLLLPEQDRVDIRAFLWDAAFKQPQPPLLLNKLIEIIVSISKYEYPQLWPSFVQELLQDQNASASSCISSLKMLEFFSMEINDFAENSLTSARAGEMLNTFEQELPSVITFIQKSLSIQNNEVIDQSLRTLRSLVKWIDLRYFFETDLLNQLCVNFLNIQDFTQNVINILAEIVSMNFIPEEYYPQMGPIFATIVNGLRPILANPDSIDDSISSLLSNTMTSFLTLYYEVVEKPELAEPLMQMLQWILQLTAVIVDGFDSCVDFWYDLTQRVHSEIRSADSMIVQFYSPLFPQLRRTLMQRIPAPFEFNNVEEEDGFRARKIISKTNFGDLYTNTKDALVYLTHIDSRDTVEAIGQMQSSVTENFSIETITATCWSFGAVVGALSEQTEKLFVTGFIMFFIELYNRQPEDHIDARKCIAEAVCFVCWQANKFLLRDETLFRNIVNWMFQLLQFPDEDTKSITIECLKSLCKTNRDQVVEKPPNGLSLLEQLLQNFQVITSSLSENSLHSCFELTGALIRAVPSNEVCRQMFKIAIHFVDTPLSQILPLHNLDPPTCHQLTLLMQCNATFAVSLGEFYPSYFISKVDLLLQAYMSLVNGIIQASRGQERVDVTVKAMKTASDSIINLFDKTINFCRNREVIKNTIIPICMTSFLESFANAPPFAKPTKVLPLFGTLAVSCNTEFCQNYLNIFSKLYHPVLEMIRPNFVDYEAIRGDFYNFVFAIVSSCLELLISFQNEELNLFIEGIKFGCCHPQLEISEKSHNILLNFINGLKQKLPPEVMANFSRQYALSLLLFTFEIMTDTAHKFAFSYQVSIIKAIITLPAINELAQNIFDGLCQMFKDQQPVVIQNLLGGMFATVNEPNSKFMSVLKDFLVSVKHLLPQDPDLIAAQKKEAMEKTVKEIQSVVGLGPTPLGEMDNIL